MKIHVLLVLVYILKMAAYILKNTKKNNQALPSIKQCVTPGYIPYSNDSQSMVTGPATASPGNSL